jgi:hypothetical protein
MDDRQELEDLRRLAELEAKAGGETQAPEPSTLAVAGNAAAKGVAGFGDMFLNAPVNAYNVAKAGAVLAGDAVGTDLRDTLTETPQPNLIQKGFEKVGLIDPAREPQTAGQRILDMAIQSGVGMAVNPGAGAVGLAKGIGLGVASGAAAGVTKELTGSELAATAVGIATPFAARVPNMSKANAPILKNPVKLQTAKDGMAAGYVVPPSHIKPSFTTNRLESMAGKAAIEQEAAVQNQVVTNKLAAKSIGLHEDTIIDDDVLDAVRKEAGKVYEKLKALVPGKELQGLKVTTNIDRPTLPGPVTGIAVKEVRGEAPNIFGLSAHEVRDEAGNLLGMRVGTSSKAAKGPLESVTTNVTSRGQDIDGPMQGMKVRVEETRGTSPVDELKQVREDAKANYRENTAKGKRQGDILMARAKEIEDRLEQAAIKSGNPELITEFRKARTLIAKTHVLERALNPGDGNIDAHKVASLLKRGEPLTGELDIIGRFASAFKKETRTASVVPSPGVSGTDAAASAMLGTAGYGAAGGPIGLAAAGLPLLRNPTRSLLLSDMYQRRLLREPQGLNSALLQSVLAGRAVTESP